jgi:hypothetical protein
MRQGWEPTPESFPNHVLKAQIAEAMEQGGARSDTAAGAAMKKGDLVATFAAGKLACAGWLPAPLQAVACT